MGRGWRAERPWSWQGRSAGEEPWEEPGQGARDQALCNPSSPGRWVCAEQGSLSSAWQLRVRGLNGRNLAWTPGASLPPTRVRPRRFFPGASAREGECLLLPWAGGLAGAAPGAQRALLAGTAGWRGLCGFSRPGQSGLTGPHASSYRGPLTLSKSGFYGPLPKSYRMPGLVVTGSSDLLSALLQVRTFTIETGSDQFVKGVPNKASAPQLALCPVHCGSL